MAEENKTPVDADVQLALEELAHIHTLKQSPAFQRYFLKEPLRKIAELEKRLLGDEELDEKAMLKLKVELKVWKRVRDKLADDEIGNRSIAGLGES